MAFSLQESGTREGIIRHLDSITADGIGSTDAAQVSAVKDLILKEIAALPADKSGLKLTVDATATETMRRINVQLIPIQIRA